jgi:hypothetical protein
MFFFLVPAFSVRSILICYAVDLAASNGMEIAMKNKELKPLMQRVPAMSLDELDALAEAIKALKIAVTTEQRKRRGQRGAGVLGVNGQLRRF